jgi:hypothetical protein
MPQPARKPTRKRTPAKQPETPEPAPATPTAPADLSREQLARLRQKLMAKFH